MKNKFLKAIITTLCFAILSPSVVGCSSVISNQEESKTLTIAVSKEVDSLYTLNMNTENYVVAPLVYETLVAYEDGQIVPKLAESWKWNEDSTVLTFHLKEGVTFHDGETFNAESVKANLEFYHADPNFSAIKGFALIKSVEVVDEYTVSVHYNTPCFSYLNDYCFQNVAGIVSPNVFEEDNFQTLKDVVGTGPYLYKELISGDCTRFTKNENYWGEEPYYDEVIAKYIPEASSRIQALQTGEVDLIYGSNLLTYDDYQQAISINGIQGQINEEDTLTRNLVLNSARQVTSDLKVREAIAYAVNKTEIAEGLTYGYESAADKLFVDGVPYTNITLDTERDYDLEQANALLDEAGWVMNEKTGFRQKNDKTLKLVYTYWQDVSLNKEIALAIETQLAAVGIDVETTGQDQMTWWTEGVAGNYDITMWNTEVAYTAPHKFFLEMLGTDPHLISLQALDDFADFEGAVNTFATAADTSQVKDVFTYLLNYTNDNVIDLPISYAKDMLVYNSKKISGYDFTSTPIFFDVTRVKPAE